MNVLVKSALIASAFVGTSAAAQSVERQDVAKAKIEAFLNALSKGDEQAYNALTTPDYRAFENGKIYDRKTFFELVQTGIREGMRPKFHVTDERSTIGDRVAAINYINHGSYATPTGMKDITWLEVVTLRRSGDDWQIDFLDSQVQSADEKK